MIPVDSVTEAQLWAALKPLFDLLGTTPMHVFDGEGHVLTIGRGDDMVPVVRFKHVVEDPEAESNWPIVTTGDTEHDELAYEVAVRADHRPLGLRDPVQALWPGPFPEGTPAVTKAGA